MPWFRVDDGFATSPKVLSIPRSRRLAAVGLWTIAGTWCAQHLRDGVVPAYMLEEWAADVSLGDMLVTAGLWLQDGEGYVFHDWSVYQPSKAEVVAAREKERRRKEAYRAKRAGNTGESPEDVPPGQTQVSLVPVTSPRRSPDPTRPDPTPSSTKKVEIPSATRGVRLDPSWLPSAEDVAKIRSECPGIDPQAEHVEFVDYWVAVPGAKGVKLDWPATWRNWMRRKQRDLQGSRAGRKPKGEQIIDVLELGRRMQAEEDRKAVGA